MKKKFILIICCFGFYSVALAQPVVGSSELTRELYVKAKDYVQKKDLTNAILVYNQLAQLEPKNLIYRRELAYTYFQGGDQARATQIMLPLLKANEADEEIFLTASKIFISQKKYGEASDAVDAGIKKFPKSGMLYSDRGVLFAMQKKYDKAEEAWEKGVKQDPRYHMNYYHLTKSYFISKRPIWAIIYGETFVNLEKYSMRTQEIKSILFDSYKQLISNVQLNEIASEKNQRKMSKGSSDFEQEVKNIYNKAAGLVLGGIDVDNVTMLRTRFLLEWSNNLSSKYPMALFSLTNKLIEEGHFVAYNQWLFGKSNNEKLYTTWAKTQVQELNSFEEYFRTISLVPSQDQYYK